MRPLDSAAEPLVSHTSHDPSTITLVAATLCLVWYIVVVVVCAIGYIQIWRHYSAPPPPVPYNDVDATPHLTIIRPVKSLEPHLYACLASTFRQSYPKEKVHIRFCISSRDDLAITVLERLVRDFPDFDAQILVEEEDALLQKGKVVLGPNPKIRNMSRAYREAKGDLVWIVDCNVWVGKDTCARMVALAANNKIVHQLPLVVDTPGTTPLEETQAGIIPNGHAESRQIRTTSDCTGQHNTTTLRKRDRSVWNIAGGRMEEVYMNTYHPKFYIAINTVLVAPAMLGKSCMFKRSHLNHLTPEDNRGIDYFSENICEDQLIGDLLWKNKVLEETAGKKKLGKHALCFGDLAIQPMANMSLGQYWQRRVRWLRVRKFTVTLATFVEPATESLLCSVYGAFALTTLPLFSTHIPPTWLALILLWLLSVSIWCLMDWTLYNKLQSARTIDAEDENTPDFVRRAPTKNGGRRRSFFREWFPAWLGREVLALPIWTWAFYGGTEVEWRGRRFWVGVDMKVHEVVVETETKAGRGGIGYGVNGKVRYD